MNKQIVFFCAAAIILADLLFALEFIAQDRVGALPLAFILIGMTIASAFLIHNYCFSSKRGEKLYLAQLVLYCSYSIIFSLHHYVGVGLFALLTACYIASLIFIFLKIYSSNSRTRD